MFWNRTVNTYGWAMSGWTSRLSGVVCEGLERHLGALRCRELAFKPGDQTGGEGFLPNQFLAQQRFGSGRNSLFVLAGLRDAIWMTADNSRMISCRSLGGRDLMMASNRSFIHALRFNFFF